MIILMEDLNAKSDQTTADTKKSWADRDLAK